jgi:hypothetical protein
MSCRDERTFNGILCEDCAICKLWQSLMGENWEAFRDDWYASHLWQQRRLRIYKEEMRYKVLIFFAAINGSHTNHL